MLISNVVPELPINGPRYSPFGAENMDDRVSAIRVRARRQRIMRTAALLLITGALLALTVIWRRDTQTISLIMRTTQSTATAIQAHVDRTGLLPATVPGPETQAYSYASYPVRFYAEHSGERVILANTAPIPLLLHPNGRAAIIYEKGRVRTEWMGATEFSEAYKAQIRNNAEFERQHSSRPPVLP